MSEDPETEAVIQALMERAGLSREQAEAKLYGAASNQVEKVQAAMDDPDSYAGAEGVVTGGTTIEGQQAADNAVGPVRIEENKVDVRSAFTGTHRGGLSSRLGGGDDTPQG